MRTTDDSGHIIPIAIAYRAVETEPLTAVVPSRYEDAPVGKKWMRVGMFERKAKRKVGAEL